MGTNSNRSAGTQSTKKGIVQGTALVDPVSGNSVAVIQDVNGVKRLAVDANLTAQVPEIVVDVRYTDGDSVAVGDPNTNTTLKIEPDGSINANVVLNSVQDSITIGDISGNLANVTVNHELQVSDSTTHTDLSTIDTDLNAFKAANHSDLSSLQTENHADLTQIDTDLNSFKTANHTDLTQIDSDLVAFKTSNHTDVTGTTTAVNFFATQNHSDLSSLQTENHADLSQLDSDLVAFKNANHSDLTTLDSDVKSVQGTSGSPVPSRINQVGGKDGSGNLQPMAVTTSGHPIVEGAGTTGAPSGGVLSVQGTGNNNASPVIVAGSGAVGSAPVNNPVSVSGVDESGLKRSILQTPVGAIYESAVENYYLKQGAAFTADTNLVAIGTAETSLLLIKNPTGSTIALRIIEYSFGIENGKSGYARVYLNPTVTANGTALTVGNLKQTAGVQGTGQGQAFKSPTVSANGILIRSYIFNNSGNIGTANPRAAGIHIRLEAGASMLVTIQNSSTGVNSNANVVWIEYV